MKGLENAIGVSIVHPTWQATRPGQDKHCGWAFASPSDAPFSSSAGYGSFPPSGCVPDTVNGAKFVRDLYELAHDTGGKYSVPVLWDKKKQTIVSNESADIIQVRARCVFFPFAKTGRYTDVGVRACACPRSWVAMAQVRGWLWPRCVRPRRLLRSGQCAHGCVCARARLLFASVPGSVFLLRVCKRDKSEFALKY